MKYIPPNPPDPNVKTFYNSAGVECVNKIREYKFNYGNQLPSGHGTDNERTRGAPRRDKFKLSFDSNGQTKLEPLQNHGQQVPYCYGSTAFGANNDIQLIHMPDPHNKARTDNDAGEEPTPLTRLQIEEMSNLLCAAKRSGLNAANSLHIINRYLTSYCCKGGQSLGNWKQSSQLVIQEYCKRDGNENKRLRSIVAKLMLEISAAMTIPRDQALFLGGGGLLKRTSHGTIGKASVSSTTISEIPYAIASTHTTENVELDETQQKMKSRFTLTNIQKRYKSRHEQATNMSLYEWCIHCWKKDQTMVPQFFGYHTRPTWPMSKTFAKWTLILHRPWRRSPTEVLAEHALYVTALNEYFHMNECRVPYAIWNGVLRAKRNEKEVIVNGSVAIAGNPGALSPTNDRTNEHLDDTADNALTPQGNDPTEFEDMNEQALERLRKPPTEYMTGQLTMMRRITWR